MPLPYPHFLLAQFFVEQGILLFLFGQRRGLAALVVGIAARPGNQPAPVQIDDAGGQVLQEGAVMGDEQQGALEVQQLFLQPGDAFQVQMVGRFVQQQHFRFDDQRPGQRHPAQPAAGELTDPAVGRQLQAAQDIFHALPGLPAMQGFQAVLQFSQFLQLPGILSTHGLRQGMIALQQFPQVAQAIGDRIVDAAFRWQMRGLLQPGQFQFRLAPHLAAVGRNFSGDDLQQGGLAFAVAPQQANPFPGIELEFRLLQKVVGAKGDGNIFQSYQWHSFLNRFPAASCGG